MAVIFLVKKPEMTGHMTGQHNLGLKTRFTPGLLATETSFSEQVYQKSSILDESLRD